jgi:hypothetical protein
MLERDLHRCVVCGATVQLEAQHRRAVGMGGSKLLPLIADLVTACSVHNAAFEADLQADALRFGWKVRSWVLFPELVPVFYRRERRWCRLSVEGVRFRVTEVLAMQMMQDVYGDAYDVEKGLVA